MAKKPRAESVAITCALLAFVMLFSAFVAVSCHKPDDPTPSGNPRTDAPASAAPESSRVSPPFTYNLTPVPLAPESSTPAAPHARRH